MFFSPAYRQTVNTSAACDEVALHTKLKNFYKQSPEYYTGSTSCDFNKAKAQMLQLLDHVIKETKGYYPIFPEYRNRVAALKKEHGDPDKRSALHQSKKAIEEHLELICDKNKIVNLDLFQHFDMDHCGSGAGSGFSNLITLFGVTKFQSALAKAKSNRLFQIVQAYVQDRGLCSHVGNEIHYVTAFFNHIASDFGCEARVDNLPPSNLTVNKQDLLNYLKKHFTLNAFLDELHLVLQSTNAISLPQSKFDAALDSTEYKKIGVYAEFIEPIVKEEMQVTRVETCFEESSEIGAILIEKNSPLEDSAAVEKMNYVQDSDNLERKLYALYDMDDTALIPKPKREFDSLLNALIVTLLVKNGCLEKACYFSLKGDKETIKYVFNGSELVKEYLNKDNIISYALLTEEEKEKIQDQILACLLNKDHSLNQAPCPAELLLEMLDSTHLLDFFKESCQLASHKNLSKRCFDKILQKEALFERVLDEIILNELCDENQLLDFAKRVFCSPTPFSEDKLEEKLRLVFNSLSKLDSAKTDASNLQGGLIALMKQQGIDLMQQQWIDQDHVAQLAAELYRSNIWAILISGACKKGALLAIQTLVKNLKDFKVDGTIINKEGDNLILLAVKSGQLEILKFLVERGASLKVFDVSGNNIAMVAAQNGSVAILNYLHRVEPSLIEPNTRIISLLTAARSNQANVLKFFVETLGMNPRKRNSHGISALMRAAKYGALDSLRYLLKLGVHTAHEINASFKLALLDNQAAAVDLLLEHGTNLHYSFDLLYTGTLYQDVTPLTFALKTTNIPLLKVLFKHFILRGQGAEILCRAVRVRNKDSLKEVLSCPEVIKYINKTNNEGDTPLWIALKEGKKEDKVELINELVAKGANRMQPRWWTPFDLRFELRNCPKEVVDNVNAFIQIKKKQGYREKFPMLPLEFAKFRGQRTLIESLTPTTEERLEALRQKLTYIQEKLKKRISILDQELNGVNNKWHLFDARKRAKRDSLKAKFAFILSEKEFLKTPGEPSPNEALPASEPYSEKEEQPINLEATAPSIQTVCKPASPLNDEDKLKALVAEGNAKLQQAKSIAESLFSDKKVTAGFFIFSLFKKNSENKTQLFASNTKNLLREIKTEASFSAS